MYDAILSYDEKVLLALMDLESTPEGFVAEAARELSGYYKPLMRLATAGNKRVPKDVLVKLTNDKNKVVADAAKKTLADLNQEQQGDK